MSCIVISATYWDTLQLPSSGLHMRLHTVTIIPTTRPPYIFTFAYHPCFVKADNSQSINFTEEARLQML